MRAFLIALIGTSLVFAADAKDEAVKKDLAAMQGTWRIVAFEFGGQKQEVTENDGGLPFEIKDDRLIATDKSPLQISMKIDPTCNPALMDLVIVQDLKGKKTTHVHEGIYELKGDTLRFCFTITPDLKDRPVEFSALADSGRQIITLKRDKQ